MNELLWLATALTAPLVVSLTLNAWQAVWDKEVSGPLSRRNHATLMALQAAVVLLLLVGPVARETAFYVVSGLYASLAIGALILRVRRGAVPCGCWGKSSRPISPFLIVSNLALASAAFAAARAEGSWGAVEGMAALMCSLALAVTATVILPDALYVRRGLVQRASRFVEWLRDYPSLGRGEAK